MTELTYTKKGDFLIPDLTLDETPRPLGKYGRMRRTYLEQNDPTLLNYLTLKSRLEQMMPGLAKAAGATEALKAEDPMRWVGLMNNCKAQAEEVILAELIYN